MNIWIENFQYLNIWIEGHRAYIWNQTYPFQTIISQNLTIKFFFLISRRHSTFKVFCITNASSLKIYLQFVKIPGHFIHGEGYNSRKTNVPKRLIDFFYKWSYSYKNIRFPFITFFFDIVFGFLKNLMGSCFFQFF